MIITTTPSVEGKSIVQYLGIVTGEAIMGANMFKDLFAGLRDMVGGRSATYERELQRARHRPGRNGSAGRPTRGQRRSRCRSRLRGSGPGQRHADGLGLRHRRPA